MTNSNMDKGPLDFDAARAGLVFAEDSHGICAGPVDTLIERLLDQISSRNRDAFPGEELHFRRSIASYAAGDIHSAFAFAFYAATAGASLIPNSELPEPDASHPLRQALEIARSRANEGRG